MILPLHLFKFLWQAEGKGPRVNDSPWPRTWSQNKVGQVWPRAPAWVPPQHTWTRCNGSSEDRCEVSNCQVYGTSHGLSASQGDRFKVMLPWALLPLELWTKQEANIKMKKQTQIQSATNSEKGLLFPVRQKQPAHRGGRISGSPPQRRATRNSLPPSLYMKKSYWGMSQMFINCQCGKLNDPELTLHLLVTLPHL
jgi:hypothetical protein